MIEPRTIVFEPDAVSALFEILNIMTDQLMEGNMVSRWDAEAVVDLQMRRFHSRTAFTLSTRKGLHSVTMDGPRTATTP